LIHDVIKNRIQSILQTALIDNIDPTDKAIPGLIIQGPLQGQMDPDTARIYVNIFENDPDGVIGDGLNASTKVYNDTIEEVELGGAITWRRYFTIRARCLLVDSAESLSEASQIASRLRSRMEKALIRGSYGDLSSEGEYVSRGPLNSEIDGETFQSGGPESYDFHITIHIQLLTTAV
jgi:hypothetical protein